MPETVCARLGSNRSACVVGVRRGLNAEVTLLRSSRDPLGRASDCLAGRIGYSGPASGDRWAMSASKRVEKIAALQEKLQQLKAREQAVEARRRTLESRRSRKADTRRKILVGAIVLAKVERGEISDADLRRWLDGALTREDDRGLFSL